MTVRAKFQCVEIKQLFGNPDGSAEVRLTAVYGNGEANKEWSQWTPQGNLTMLITNPAAIDQFDLGAEYFIDFTPASAS